MQNDFDYLEQFVDLKKANVNPQYNLDDPQSCDLCGKSFSSEIFLIDGEVRNTEKIPLPNGESMGQWAYMCAKCFKLNGVGIKWGKGQLYKRVSDDEWLLVSGFPPDDLTVD